MQLQLNGRKFFIRFGKQIMLAYSLLGVAMVAWTFNESISFLEGVGIVLYVAGVILLRRVVTRPKSLSDQRIFPEISKSDKAKIIKDMLWIAVCFGGAFVVMIVGTLTNPTTKSGFMIIVEVPIFILAFVIVALITRISFRLLNLKRYFDFPRKPGGLS
jgi:drug/metabolite transporter (DMT)-like permease